MEEPKEIVSAALHVSSVFSASAYRRRPDFCLSYAINDGNTARVGKQQIASGDY
jgi:hypothetical protein